ncbi:MAG TPA: 2-succinyl-5-enolpyruvyl-6-hydroxy-3-cyclohexene-1-carboxylic-acid synthase, partial [Aggregatilineales bacterium]|nr:2-succinyl-5-enolpyruvyl-6-hydroxy-3-cyclohexene-1-carboxylic-acid synthase [Aggregatilineales bacterium]
MNPQEALHVYVSAFVDELGRSGVHNVVICPGSRSTPLAMIFAEQEKLDGRIKIWMHIDERSAAYFALGMAKASRQPVAVLCTSGTAAANFMPSVVEAYYSRVPLIVLTADRPPELRDVGAAQAIDQVRLYGSHTKWYQEMALPDATPDLLRYVRMTACRAAAEAVALPAGPVHLNFPFREPLVPLRSPDESWYRRQVGDAPLVSVVPEPDHMDHGFVKALFEELVTIERGLIVCGPQDDPYFPSAVVELAERLNYPLLADPLSQVRCRTCGTIIANYDAILRDADFVARFEPSVILKFGAIPTSKPLVQYLGRYPDCRQIFVTRSRWEDPTFLASTVIRADPENLCCYINYLMRERSETEGAIIRGVWASAWLEASEAAKGAVSRTIEEFTSAFEARVFTELADFLPAASTLYLGSSMPVRDGDTFFPATEKKIRFLSNRGANGIDGVVSSALGASTVTSDPLVLVLGDLSFYHDMNGLLAAKLHHLNATIIVINNDGGGIFSFLPQAGYPEHFESLYGTPTGLDFSHTAALYGATFH